jgi:hypothetical protein
MLIEREEVERLLKLVDIALGVTGSTGRRRTGRDDMSRLPAECYLPKLLRIL